MPAPGSVPTTTSVTISTVASRYTDVLVMSTPAKRAKRAECAGVCHLHLATTATTLAIQAGRVANDYKCYLRVALLRAPAHRHGLKRESMASQDRGIPQKRLQQVWLYRTDEEEHELIATYPNRSGSLHLWFQKGLFYRNYLFRATRGGGLEMTGLDARRVIMSLAAPDAEVFRQNEHCRQRFVHAERSAQGEYAPQSPEDVIRQVEDLPAQLAYRARGHTYKSVHHDGQRKLLLSEIQFLTRFYDAEAPPTVVYVGAAPGKHIPLLVDMFPGIKFELYDPRRFDQSVARHRQSITVHLQYFTDRDAADWAACDDGRPLLFISDIREASDTERDSHAMERGVAGDMRMQQKWVKTVKPRAAMLKFRLPYTSETARNASVEYLDGYNMLPVYGPATTTETRLIVEPINTGVPRAERTYATRLYSTQGHEELLSFFNIVVRSTPIPGLNIPPERNTWYDACHDCASEIQAIAEYAEKLGASSQEDHFYQQLESHVTYGHGFKQRHIALVPDRPSGPRENRDRGRWRRR